MLQVLNIDELVTLNSESLLLSFYQYTYERNTNGKTGTHSWQVNNDIIAILSAPQLSPRRSLHLLTISRTSRDCNTNFGSTSSIAKDYFLQLLHKECFLLGKKCLFISASTYHDDVAVLHYVSPFSRQSVDTWPYYFKSFVRKKKKKEVLVVTCKDKKKQNSCVKDLIFNLNVCRNCT